MYPISQLSIIPPYGVDLSTSKCIRSVVLGSYYLWCVSVLLDWRLPDILSVVATGLAYCCSAAVDLGPHYYLLLCASTRTGVWYLRSLLLSGTVWLCALVHCYTYVLPVHQTCGVVGVSSCAVGLTAYH